MVYLQERKAKKEGIVLPTRDQLKLSDFNPQHYAVKVWLDERKLHRDLCDEVRRVTTDVGMKPADQRTRLAHRSLILLTPTGLYMAP